MRICILLTLPWYKCTIIILTIQYISSRIGCIINSVVIIKLNMLHFSNIAPFSYVSTYIQMGMAEILTIYHIISCINQIQTRCQQIMNLIN